MCIYCGTNKYRKIYEHHYGAIPKDDQGRSYHIHHIDGDNKNNNPDNLQALSIVEHYNIHKAQGDWGACYKLSASAGLTQEQITETARKAAQLGNQKRLANGTHQFLSGEIQRKTNRNRIDDGTHKFLDPDFQEFMKALNNKRVQDGTHNFVGGQIQKEASLKRVAEGTHNFQSGDIQRLMHTKHKEAGTHHSQREEYKRLRSTINKQKVDAGTHHFVGDSNPVYKELEKGTHNFLGGAIQHKRVCEGSHHLLAANRKKVECEHCGMITITTNYARWHGPKCKRRPSIS